MFHKLLGKNVTAAKTALSGSLPTLAMPMLFALCLSGCNWVSLVSQSSTGVQANNSSYSPSLSGDGRYVVFTSLASNLVAGDSNGRRDVFVRDTATNQITRVSVDSAGNESNDNSFGPSISADGRYVAFHSLANNLVDDDTNVYADIFFHDRQTGETTLISVGVDGFVGNLASFRPVLSADGRFVAFESQSSNLIVGDTNGQTDVFVHDRQTATTSRVSVSTVGAEGNSRSFFPAISADGMHVAFWSYASNLVEDDTNFFDEIFVHDRNTGITTRVSVNSDGSEANGRSYNRPSLSAHGRYVAFESSATNLVYGDTNSANDIFVHDRQSGLTTMASVNNFGQEGNNYSVVPVISDDGQYVAFLSSASNLVSGDTGAHPDVFVHDRHNATTERVSVDALGAEGNDGSTFVAISADGRYVAFESDASNFIRNDQNSRQDIIIRAVQLASVEYLQPNMIPIGSTTSIRIVGSNFFPDAKVLVPTGLVSNTQVIDPNSVELDLTVEPSATPGAHDVLIILPGTGGGGGLGSVSKCTGCITYF